MKTSSTIGIIGYGSAGKRIGRLLVERCGIAPGLITAYDSDAEAVKDSAAHRFKVVHADLSRGGWPALDSALTFICTPTNTHARQLSRWLYFLVRDQAWHRSVYVEKPVCSIGDFATVETERVADQLDVRRMVGLVGYNMRFHPAVHAAHKWLRSRSSLVNVRAYFTCLTDMSTWPGARYGTVLEECSHEIDLALHLLGPGTVAYCDRSAKADIEIDFSHEPLRLGERVVVIHHVCGARSYVTLDGDSQVYRRSIVLRDKTADFFCWHTDNFDRLGECTHPLENGVESPFAWSADTMYAEALRDFLDSDRVTPRGCTLRQGLEVMAICNAAENWGKQ